MTLLFHPFLSLLRLHRLYHANNMSGNQKLVGWQLASGGRNTLDIIENCLLTILACTWSIQHLNVPKRDTEWYWILGTKIKWAVFTVFFPELILAYAILEFIMAWKSLKSFKKIRSELLVERPWVFQLYKKPVRWFLCICNAKGSSSDPEKGIQSLLHCIWHPKSKKGLQGSKPPKPDWTLTHTYFANMGGFYLIEEEPKEPRKGISIQAICLEEDANFI